MIEVRSACIAGSSGWLLSEDDTALTFDSPNPCWSFPTIGAPGDNGGLAYIRPLGDFRLFLTSLSFWTRFSYCLF